MLVQDRFMRRSRLFVALLALFGMVNSSLGQLSVEERKGIEDALFIANLGLKDLEFERKPFSPKFPNALVNLSIDRPLEAADQLMRIHGEAKVGPIARLLAVMIKDVLADSWPRELQPTVALPPDVQSAPAALRPVLTLLILAMQEANNQVRKALAALSTDELRTLVEGLPVWCLEEPKVKLSFVKRSTPSLPVVLALLERVELWRIRAAAVALAETVEKTIPLLKRVPITLAAPLKFSAGGMSVVLAGRASDRHVDMDARLTIDFGGDDEYLGRHGAGIGYSSVLIDLGGNDRYDVPDASIGCGLMGIGIARDLGGTDQFLGKSLCFGSGVGGVGVFAKDGGHDQYRATSMAQGFGAFGIGLCLDGAGDDVYELKLLGQGAARTAGAGWQMDRLGSDIYRAGGLSWNEPLFKGVSYSNAQGFGSGFREDTGGVAGGVGLLTDLSGQDSYLADTYAQGASYWFALGTLFDQTGNDTYSGYHYCQASAMHISGAYLFDLAGDDGFLVKFGAAHSIGHDYGVAFFLDRSGDDVYAARDSNPGVGNANGLALFIDASGVDRYQGPPGKGNPARSTGSLGLFVDLFGQDLYRDGLRDGSAHVREGWGIAFDQSIPLGTDGPPPTQIDPPRPGSIPRPPDAELAQLYQRATQWGVGQAQEEVAASLQRLIGIGMPAFTWMCENRLKNADRLQMRAFTALVQALGPPARDAIALKVRSADLDEQRVALSVCIDAVVKEVGPLLAPLLASGGLRRAAVRAAGAIGAKEVVGLLIPMTLDPDRLIALDSMIALSLIGDPSANSTAQALYQSGNLPMRKAALSLLVKHPEESILVGKSLVLQDEERLARLGIELLGALGTPQALQEIGPKLIDPRPGVRIQAMLALNGRIPTEFRQYLATLKTDPIPTVRAIAQEIDPGR